MKIRGGEKTQPASAKTSAQGRVITRNHLHLVVANWSIAVTSVEYIDRPLKVAVQLGSEVLPQDIDMNEHIGQNTCFAVIAAETVHLLPA